MKEKFSLVCELDTEMEFLGLEMKIGFFFQNTNTNLHNDDIYLHSQHQPKTVTLTNEKPLCWACCPGLLRVIRGIKSYQNEFI